MTTNFPEVSPDSSLEENPNRVLLYINGGSTFLKNYPGDDEMRQYVRSLPSQEQTALQEGVILSIRCVDGVYECSLNTENGDININPINPKPQEINVNLRDEIFPGEEHLLLFLQERLTKRYPIGGRLRLHFKDVNVSYQIGLIPSPLIVWVQEWIQDAIEKTLATSSHPE